ncbi:MAG: hypothetical protein KME15_18735 [Drouetiella hepatica Uher 2000/2452]|jgi:hypothetical protein|uniref:Uncharacterized protein n=1 Tax=Drouetiella hepatica Uher 2000/2452 TaxID=904376 RepID=A0A951QDU1_9CYAN|nr:hypothetical protein [Drouetiella hepatica Uher 2000/2452]
MVTLSDDEVVLIRSILTALRAIKVRDIDKALVICRKAIVSQTNCVAKSLGSLQVSHKFKADA